MTSESLFNRATPEMKAQQVKSNLSAPATPKQLPQKVNRARSNSTSVVTPPAPIPNRKRTSSGVFQVDESEPSPKKNVSTRSNSVGSSKQLEVVANGRRKNSDSEQSGDKKKLKQQTKEQEKELSKEKKKEKVIERFDSEAKTTCVSAFKESDSWD